MITLSGPAAPARRGFAATAAFVLMLFYVGMLYVRPQDFVPDFQDVPIMPVLLAAAFACWLFTGERSFRTSPHRIVIVMVFFFCFTVAITGWPGGFVARMVQFAPMVIMFLLVSDTADSTPRLVAMAVLLSLVAILVSVHGIDQSADPEGVGWTGMRLAEGTRITYAGILNDPNDLAQFLLMCLPLLALVLGRTRSRLLKLAWYAGGAVVLYGVFLTNSRGGLLALLTQAMLLFKARYGYWKAGVLGAVGLAGVALMPSRLSQLDAEEESAAGRIDSWYEGIEMLKGSPVWGVGQGNFTDHHPLAAHNSLVVVFAEVGLVGYFLWLAFVGLSAYLLVLVLRQPEDAAANSATTSAQRDHKSVARALLFSFLGFMFTGFFLSRSYSPTLFLLCGLCVATYLADVRVVPSIPQPRLGQFAGRLVVIELASIVVIFVLVKVLL